MVLLSMNGEPSCWPARLFSCASRHYRGGKRLLLRAFRRRQVVPTLIGIDVGTTAVKAVLIVLFGFRLAEFSRPHPMHRPEAGAAEQDPADWMGSVLDALQAFATQHDLRGLAGIGICSQVNTHVFVDAAGAPVRAAITWQDGRAAPEGAGINAQVSAQQKIGRVGGPVP